MIELNGPRLPIGNTAPVDMPEIDLSNFDSMMGEVKGVLHDFGPDTVLLDSSQYFLATGSNVIPSDLNSVYIEQEDFAEGRKYSMNGVHFGQMIVASSELLDLPEFVAVKPHIMGDPMGVSVMRELAAHNHMNSLSTTEKAYVPLGIWKDSKGMPQLVTLYDHAVQTYDNVFWPSDKKKAAEITSQQVDEALRTCLYGLGLLHGAGVGHGDAQPKNLGRDRRTVRFADFEETELLPLDPSMADEAKSLIDNDIATFISATMFYNDVNGRVIDMTAEALANETKRDELISSYQAGIVRSGQRLNVALPVEATLSKDEILHHFDLGVQMSELYPGSAQ